MARCADATFPSLIPFVTLVLPAPGSDIRMKMGWKVQSKTRKSGVWSFQNAGSGGRVGYCRCSWVRLIGYGRDRTTQRGRFPVVPHARGPAVGPHTGERCWSLLAGVWRAIAPLMKPWCAEGEVPTAANLNLYLGLHSRVGCHCDDEPLFGRAGCSMLIVPVSFGSQALFRWKGKSCLDGDASSCYFGHGDILVIDGQCQDEFLHCTDPGLEQERINVTFRSIRQHACSCPLRAGVVCCLPTCAQGFSVPVMENGGLAPLGFCGGSLGSCVYGGYWFCWSFPSSSQGSGYGGVFFAGHAFWAEVGGDISFATLGEFLGSLKKVLWFFIGEAVILGILC